MAGLSIRLLGPFEVLQGSRPVTDFESDKVRALLAYLATKADQPQRRETLAGLLWPEMPESVARANLRYALANLRSVIGDREATPPFLLITRPTIQFNVDSDAQVDALAFMERLAGGQLRGRTVQELEDAIELVRGEFLQGLSLRDSLPFEEWLLLQREHVARLRLAALHRLTAFHRAQGTYESALRYAWQQVDLEPYEEEAQQQLIHLLAVTGQRAAALSRYESLRQMLADDLGVEPSTQTQRLYRQILSGEIEPEETALRDQIIRGYDLLEPIGAGTFGAVYRAYQPVLGREVAVKVIRPEYASRPSFIRRFEAEAQMVARLEHLHIVPLYDYWREPDGAYLVMRLFPAGSLEDSLAKGPWELEAAARAVDQIASALASAHGQGIVHRDVKPANILLDAAGNAYLSDFSIAREVAALPDAATPPTLTVSPEYAAPEQWRRVRLTPGVDVYSLGMVLYELLAGAHPFAGASVRDLHERHLHATLPPIGDVRPEVPRVVDDVIQRATAKAPRDRFASAAQLAQALGRALESHLGRLVPAAEIPLAEPQNPFRGLRPFLEADAAHFFGRDDLTEQLVGRLAQSSGPRTEPAGEVAASSPSHAFRATNGCVPGFLAVVGPSGSGKSSVVRAGLVPALRSGALPGSESWYITTMQPGTAPIEELEAGLMRVAVRGVAALRQTLDGDERGLLRAAELVLPEPETEVLQADLAPTTPEDTAQDLAGGNGCTLLLVVDQFEELYAPAVDPVQREHFLRLIHEAATDAHSRVCVVVTLRADFYDRPLRHPLISHLLRARSEVVVPLTRDELSAAICGPAEQVGMELEPGLLDEIVGQVADQPGALPMFQYALTELFERRAGRLLTWEAFRDIGGVTGAVARRAEAVYAELDEAGQTMARQVFLRLVTPGEAADESSPTPETRRRVFLTELMALRVPVSLGPSGADGGPDTETNPVETVIDAFGRARLLLFDRDPATRSPTVEVAHEALLGAWKRLAGWLQESWADLRMERLLAGATGEWLVAGRDPGFLLSGTRLAQFEGWAADSTVALTPDEEALLEASISARVAREAEREAQRQRELASARALAEAERRRAEEQAEGARRLRRRALYLAGALLVAVLLALAAGLFGEQARRNANLAATRQAEAEAESRLRATAQIEAESEAHLRATAQIEAEDEAHLRATAESVAVAERVVAEDRARVATSRELATAAQGIVGLDPELAVLLALEAVSVAETYEAENVLHQVVPALRLIRQFLGHEGSVTRLAVAPDRGWLATMGTDQTVRLWDLDSSRSLLTLRIPDRPTALALSRDGRYLAVGGTEGTLEIWMVAEGDAIEVQELHSLQLHAGRLHDLAFSRDGLRLVTGGEDHTARVVDVESGLEKMVLTGQGDSLSTAQQPLIGLTRVRFVGNGRSIATGGADAVVRVWDAETGQELFSVEGHEGAVTGMDVNPAGTRLASSSEDGTIRIWDLGAGPSRGQMLLRISGRADSVAFSDDGSRLAAAGSDGIARVLDAYDGDLLNTISSHSGRRDVVLSPDGLGLITTGDDGTPRLWNISLAQELLVLEGTGAGVAFSADGNLLATGTLGGAIVWDLTASLARQSGVRVSTMLGHEGADQGLVRNVALSRDGRRTATAGTDGTVRVWDTATGQPLQVLLSHSGTVWDLAFDASGRLLASAGSDGVARLWDVTSGQQLLALAAHRADAVGVDLSSDGALLATSSWDGTVSVWDVTTWLGSIEEQELPLEIDASGALYVLSLDSEPFDVVFHPDGTMLAAGGRDGAITVWTLPQDPGRGGAGTVQPEVVYKLAEQGWRITRLVWSPDGRRLATAGGDARARVWDLESGRELLVFSLHRSFLTGVAFSPDGNRLATSAGRTTQLYTLRLDVLVELARERLTRTLTDQECQQYLHVEACPPEP